MDLDGTLAHHDQWLGVHHIGAPIEPMVALVRGWISEGRDVRIVTARVSGGDPDGARPYIESWCARHLGAILPITSEKDWMMRVLYDDRCVSVETNTGRILTPEAR